MYISDKGATYEFRISAKNNVDYGEQAVKTIRTPDGSELQSPTQSPSPPVSRKARPQRDTRCLTQMCLVSPNITKAHSHTHVHNSFELHTDQVRSGFEGQTRS